MKRKSFLTVIVIAIISTYCATEILAQSQLDYSDNKLTVCLMGDPQLIMVPETPENVDIAMRDLANMDHEFLAVLGDLAQNKAHFYEDYKNLIVDKSKTPVFSLAGNGDVGAGLEAYKEATGLPLYYSYYRKGIRFIFLSTISMTGDYNHICHLGEEQLSWLTEELASDRQSTTILFSHPPVFETTWHSEVRDHLGSPGSMYLSESAELRTLFGENPNVKVYAHGHLHHRSGLVDEFGRGDFYMEGNVLHISVSATANNQGSSFLSIDENEIRVNVRDHTKQEWKDGLEYQYKLPTTFNSSDSSGLNWAINPLYDYREDQGICEGESYFWHGTEYTISGTYNANYTSVTGYDSTYTLNLTVYAYTEDQEICEGEFYSWQGAKYSTSGTYMVKYTSVRGCDSTYTLNLTVGSLYDYTEEYEICEGESYSWHGTEYTNSGTYKIKYPSVHGCDSTYTLNLTVGSMYTYTEEHEICEGESYTWRGTEYTTSGTYKVKYPSVHGCDSIYELLLNVNSFPLAGFTYETNENEVKFTDTSVNASSYLWDFGDSETDTTQNPVHVYTGSGNYSVLLTAYSEYCGEATDTQMLSITMLNNSIEFGDIAKIYPNPAGNGEDIRLELAQGSEISNARLSITDLSGKLVYTEELNGQKAISISTAQFNKGVYLLCVESLNSKKCMKVIFE